MPEMLKPNSSPSQRREPTPVSLYSKLAYELRRIRRGFTHENVVSVIYTLIWVAPLTLLIWIYAEREQEVENPVLVAINVVSTDPTRIATLTSKENVISCTVQAAKSQFEKLASLLNARNPVIIPIDPSAGLGDDSISVQQKIEDSPRFKNLGIAIKNCLPSVVSVHVDRLVEEDAPVTAPSADVVPTLEHATFDPPMVKVRGPKARIDELKSQGRLVAVADIANLPALNVAGHAKLTVPLRPIDPSGDVSCLVGNVEATLDVKTADTTLVLKLTVVPAVPYPVQQSYAIDLSPESRSINITVTGPGIKIDQLKASLDTLNLLAFVPITDLGMASNPPKSITPIIGLLPDGIKVVPGSIPQVVIEPHPR